jgi:hypothetical protein
MTAGVDGEMYRSGVLRMHGHHRRCRERFICGFVIDKHSEDRRAWAACRHRRLFAGLPPLGLANESRH